MATNLIATEYDKQTSQAHAKTKVKLERRSDCQSQFHRWSHLVVLLRYSLAHSHPCDRSVLGLSSQPWLSAQYTVKLQSAVNGFWCRFYRGTQFGPQSLTIGIHFPLGRNKGGYPLSPRDTPTHVILSCSVIGGSNQHKRNPRFVPQCVFSSVGRKTALRGLAETKRQCAKVEKC